VVDQAQTSLDEKKWQICHDLWMANKEDGLTQYRIAKQVGRSPAAVKKWINLWARRPARYSGMTFTEAYYADSDYRGRLGNGSGWTRSGAKQFLNKATTEEIEQMFLDLPDQQRAKKLASAIGSLYRKPPEPQELDATKLLRELSKLADKLVEVIEDADGDDSEAILDEVATYIYPFNLMLRPRQNGKANGLGKLRHPAR
jgi:hypothetical protein